jgi:hypothetical protein
MGRRIIGFIKISRREIRSEIPHEGSYDRIFKTAEHVLVSCKLLY